MLIECLQPMTVILILVLLETAMSRRQWKFGSKTDRLRHSSYQGMSEHWLYKTKSFSQCFDFPREVQCRRWRWQCSFWAKLLLVMRHECLTLHQNQNNSPLNAGIRHHPNQAADFYEGEIQKMVIRYNTCFNVGGNYVVN